MKWMTKTSMITAVAFAVVIGFMAWIPGSAESAQDVSKAKLASIKSVSSSGDGNSVSLVIKLSSPVTYTSYKTTAPLRLVIDFSQATQGDINVPIFVNKGNFKTVTVSRYDTDAGVLTRMDIELASDSEAVISALPSDPSELRVSFPLIASSASAPVEPNKPAKTAEVESAPPPASYEAQKPESVSAADGRTLTSITGNKNTITLGLDGAPGEFKTFRLNKPERFVVDLMDVKSSLSAKLLPLNVAGVASARIGLYPDKTRVVFDSVNGAFPEATAEKTDSAVVITIDGKPANDNQNTKLTSTRSEPAPAKASATAVSNVPAVSTDRPTASPLKTSGPASVEMIDFQVVDGISRISVNTKGYVSVDPPVKSPGFVTLTLRNTFLPKSLQRSLDSKAFFSPVLRVTPLMVKSKKGNDTKIRIAMRVDAPFDLRHEGDMLFLDFKNPEGLTADKLAAETSDQKMSASTKKASASVENNMTSELAQPQSSDLEVKSSSGSHKNYSGRKVTLEFADAEVRKIFQLLAEVSNKNFVLGDDVTGNISLKLVNVPWDQALDIILDTKDLDKREDGNIILIKKKGKFKSQAEEELEMKKTAAKSVELETETFLVNYSSISEISGQFEKLKTPDRGRISSDTRTNKVIVKDTPQAIDDMRKLLAQLDIPERQVMIEARIVEASSTFTRNLGVNWGVHKTMGTNLPFPGLNQMNSGFGGLTSFAPPTTSGSVGSTPGGSLGMMFGTLTAGIELDMRLNAAATASLIKIISSPKVATLNHKTAKISQGVQIPYQNTTATTGAVTAFVAATLSLEVTPHINANGTIVMKIDAKNDAPGTGSPPPINTKQATTEMLLRDGETTVIGGIFVESDTEADTGVPYLMDIPLFGNLFKSTEKSKTKSELLIFITPRLLNVQ